jgi:WD40 repeat protein
MHLLTGYAKPITAMAVSPDGARLYSAARGQQMIWVWDLERRAVEKKLRGEHTRHGIGALAVSPCGGWLVSADNSTVIFRWRLPDGAPKRSWYAHGARKALCAHPERPLVVTQLGRASSDKSAQGFQLLDLESGKVVKGVRGHKGEVYHLAFSAAGATLATCSADRTVRLWDIATGQPGAVLTHKLVPTRVTFRRDGEALAATAARNVLVWALPGGSLADTLEGHTAAVTGVVYSPDGKHLASAGLDGVVILRDARTNAVIGQRHLDIGKIGVLLWRPDSGGLIAGGDKHIALCELNDFAGKATGGQRSRGEPLSLAGHEHKAAGLVFSQDGKALASWSRDRVHLWDFSGGAGQARQGLVFTPQAFGDVGYVSWSADRRRLTVSLLHPSSARVYDAETGTKSLAVNRKGSGTRYLRFTPDGKLLLAFGGRQLRLELLDPDGKSVVASAVIESWKAGGFPHAAFGQDGKHIYIGRGWESVCRWRPATGAITCISVAGLTDISEDEKFVATARGNSALVCEVEEGGSRLELKHPLSVSDAAFLPGGRLLTTCYDGCVRVWDQSAGRELERFDLGMGKVYCLAVSPDRMIFAAGVEKKCRIVLMDVPE